LDVLHAFLSLVIAKLFNLKNRPVFLAHTVHCVPLRTCCFKSELTYLFTYLLTSKFWFPCLWFNVVVLTQFYCCVSSSPKSATVPSLHFYCSALNAI